MASSCSISMPTRRRWRCFSRSSPICSPPPASTAAAASTRWSSLPTTSDRCAPSKDYPMAEMERTRERERGSIPETPYEIFIRSRREFLERQETGQVVVKPSDREFYLTRQGRLMYHLNPEIHKNTPLQDWRVFSHDLKTRSGKHRHQGGLVIYVIVGTGYSVVDGERVDWQAGDLLLLPIKPGGVEHQHFNLQPGADCRWIAFSYMPFFDHVASEFTQTEVSPLFKAENPD